MWDAVKEDMKYWPVVRGWTGMKQRAKNNSQCTAVWPMFIWKMVVEMLCARLLYQVHNVMLVQSLIGELCYYSRAVACLSKVCPR